MYSEQRRPREGQITESQKMEHRGAELAERVLGTIFQSSLLSIYFRLSGFQSTLFFTSATGRILSVHNAPKNIAKTYPIYDAKRSRSARRSFAPLQKSRSRDID